jgi:small-conductance mechanosensitive channel/CRP-like cAMP-binding protein
MELWDGITAEIADDWTLFLACGVILTMILTRTQGESDGRRQRSWSLLALTALHGLLLPVAGVLRAMGSNAYPEVRLPCLIFAAMAGVGTGGQLIFGVLLPRARIRTPLILQDVVVAVASIVAVLAVASRAGFNLSGLIATSAVLTAVVGFALQDTLANIVGGLTLQLDHSLDVGDWIKFGEHAGRVAEVRWRYTAIETRNWETVIIPNSALTRSQVLVLGRRTGQPLQWRRFVYFNVDFRFQPADVIAIVMEALTRNAIERVAPDPPPNCVLMEFHESYARYAVRYWLTDIAADDPTDSVVRHRIYYALQRANIPLSIPAHAVFVTEESPKRREEKNVLELERRRKLLKSVELFDLLPEDDLTQLAEKLRHAPFTQGETLTREGAEAHWLYIIIEGEVSVTVSAPGGLEREVERLRGGQFFGEMGLLTGARREATFVATSKDVECYRLDKISFEAVMQRHPTMADHMAGILAKRRLELDAVRENLSVEAHSRHLAVAKSDLLATIQRFFGLGSDEVKRKAN